MGASGASPFATGIEDGPPPQYVPDAVGPLIVPRVTDEPHDEWTMLVFSQSNPDGAGQGSVPALLRRLADSIDELGDIVVHDITFHSEVTADENDLTMTVYYERPARTT
jgi:hypothetical protein